MTSTAKFNGSAAANVTFVSSTQLKATVPGGATTGPITVTNTAAPIGTVRSAASYTPSAGTGLGPPLNRPGTRRALARSHGAGRPTNAKLAPPTARPGRRALSTRPLRCASHRRRSASRTARDSSASAPTTPDATPSARCRERACDRFSRTQPGYHAVAPPVNLAELKDSACV